MEYLIFPAMMAPCSIKLQTINALLSQKLKKKIQELSVSVVYVRSFLCKLERCHAKYTVLSYSEVGCVQNFLCHSIAIKLVAAVNMLVVFAVFSTTCVRAKSQGQEVKQRVEAAYLVRQKFKSPEN